MLYPFKVDFILEYYSRVFVFSLSLCALCVDLCWCFMGIDSLPPDDSKLHLSLCRMQFAQLLG